MGIEIGTSSYHTFTQAVVGHPLGKPHAWKYLPSDVHPLQLRGLAVDMNRNYLDQLPDVPLVSKICTAISEKGGVEMMHHVPLEDIETWEAIFAKTGYYRGFKFVS